MKKHDVVDALLGKKSKELPQKNSGQAFAPSNIALCKYWGKRNSELNLPVTSSLSISLGKKGTLTEVKISDTKQDIVIANHQAVDPASSFSKRLIEFLNLFRPNPSCYFYVNTQTNIPTAAGLASSASGFAALVMALNQLFGWNLNASELSILARLGSGSASRSIWPGFVEWQMGTREDGMDSYGTKIPEVWPELCIGLLVLSSQEKGISSREAMQRTVTTSPFYSQWPQKVNDDLTMIKPAIQSHDFALLGKVAESNAMAMHALMLSAWPPVSYALPETVIMMQKIWKLRDQGVQIYFTQDAGPNLKLLFLKKEMNEILTHFPNAEIVQPFEDIISYRE